MRDASGFTIRRGASEQSGVPSDARRTEPAVGGRIGVLLPSRMASMRRRSCVSAARCNSDSRFSRNKVLASSEARAQAGRWRGVMHALGHRVGSQSAISGGSGRRGGLLQAERGCGIEEAIGERSDVQTCGRGLREGPHPGPVGDHRRPSGRAFRRAASRALAIRGPAGPEESRTGTAVIEIVEDIVDLAEGALRLDLGAETRLAGAGIALEGGDRGMLVLDHAGDRAERPVGDVPGDRATELASGDPPRQPIGRRRDDWRVLVRRTAR